jgi:hypothetical protein
MTFVMLTLESLEREPRDSIVAEWRRAARLMGWDGSDHRLRLDSALGPR